jgi:RNA polymerase sigma-70 factor
MMASTASAPPPCAAERASQVRIRAGVEAGFRAALLDAIDDLAVCDRNLLRFHYFHRVGIDQLAVMFSAQRAAVIRQLDRIRDRLLRDTRRGLAARLPLEPGEIDRLIDVARSRFDLVISRVLRD